MERHIIIAPQDKARMVWFRDFLLENQDNVHHIDLSARTIYMMNGDEMIFIIVSQLPEWCYGREYTCWYAMDGYGIPERWWGLLDSRIRGKWVKENKDGQEN